MQQIDHRVIKLSVGVIAVSIAFFSQFVSGEILTSISEAYHTRARDVFVGLLCAVAALFLSFSGRNWLERVLTFMASLLAAVVAIAPCACGSRPSALSTLHYPAAVGLFMILGYFCWRFRRTALAKVTKYREAKNRVLVYNVCLAGMMACGLMALAYLLAKDSLSARFPSYVFWLEALGLVSFGTSWLAASRTLPFVTNTQERFHLREGRALEDGDRPAPARD